MGKKKNKNSNSNQKTDENVNVNEIKNENENKKKDNDEGEKKKQEANPISPAVLKIDMHCEGCASKITRCVRGFEGVEAAKADMKANKLTVVGNVDPTELRDRLAEKTKKKVDLLSPQPKKDNKADDKSDQKPEKKADDKKPKEAPVTTAVFKVDLHCQGCIDKIRKTVLKTKGYKEMDIDHKKDLVTVKGTMDTKALAQNLKERLKRQVEIVPPKKEKEGGGEGGEKKDGNGGGGGKKKGGGGGDAGQEENAAGIAKVEGNRMDQFMVQPPGHGFGYGYGNFYGHGYQGYGHPGYGYGGMVGEHVHAPQIFSDENPNACSVM
ncbi:heavy metal-associated isoprenylated plant protein 3-like [Juglans microcarpa x Juglans regia]|uniref:heavy metal-associated isoprenylated plant protein 3-like n=1 Tax=Juglans microcarpa x Juglans regia TaxID=2249226 RepID=UPI001B7DC2A7|nr:heavy metal-associated isoprenylated plant protein 3-like [Juglans microcarpa x Juglans regia]